jgi:hypothetical protein
VALTYFRDNITELSEIPNVAESITIPETSLVKNGKLSYSILVTKKK